MNMAIANDAISRKSYVAATNVADDDGAIVLSSVTREPFSIFAYPIVIFDTCFYTAVFGNLNSHLAEELPRVLEEL